MGLGVRFVSIHYNIKEWEREEGRLTPSKPSDLQIRPPQPGERDPLSDERLHWAQPQARPRDEQRCRAEREPAVALVAAVPRELHAPVHRAEEGEHHRAICYLEAQRLIENRVRDARVDVRDETLCGEARLVREVHGRAGRGDVRQAAREAHDHVWARDEARACAGDANLRMR